jgi:O-antigen/teichoic acid export membrane protein
MTSNRESQKADIAWETEPVSNRVSVTIQLVIVMIGLTSTLFIARVLGPVGKGLFTLTIAFSTFFIALFSGSLGQANVTLSDNLPQSRPALVGNNIAIAFLLGALATLVFGLLFSEVRQIYYPLFTERLWAIALLSIIPMLLQELNKGFLFGANAVHKLNLMLLGKELIFLILIIILVQVDEASSVGYASLWLITMVISAILLLIQSIRLLDFNPYVDMKLMKETLNYGIKYYANGMFSILKFRFDIIIAGLFLTLADIGIYSIALAFVACLSALPAVIIPVLRKHFSGIGIDFGLDLCVLIIRTCFTSLIIIALLLVLRGKTILAVFPGPAYAPAYTVLLLLLPGAVLHGLSLILNSMTDLKSHDKKGLVSLAAILLSGVLMFILIPRFGIAGAAASSSIAYSFAGLMFLHFFLLESGATIGEVLLVSRDDFYLIFRRDY